MNEEAGGVIVQVPRPTRRSKGRMPPAATTPSGVAAEGAVIAGPGSKKRRGEVPPDDIRTMVLERIRERGLTVTHVSRALNKNEAYMHQFIWRGSPEWLGEADRAVVCRLLEIPEAVLKPPMPGTVSSSRGLLSPSVADGAGQRDVPLFREDDEINFGSTREWAFRLPGLVPGPVFAIWIAMEHDRFGPGDLIYVHLRQPPRVGDHVVAIDHQRVTAVGKLVGVGSDARGHIQGAGGQKTSTPAGASTYKVAAAIYA